MRYRLIILRWRQVTRNGVANNCISEDYQLANDTVTGTLCDAVNLQQEKISVTFSRKLFPDHEKKCQSVLPSAVLFRTILTRTIRRHI